MTEVEKTEQSTLSYIAELIKDCEGVTGRALGYPLNVKDKEWIHTRHPKYGERHLDLNLQEESHPLRQAAKDIAEFLSDCPDKHRFSTRKPFLDWFYQQLDTEMCCLEK